MAVFATPCSVEVNPEQGIRRNGTCPQELVRQYDHDIWTLYDVFWRTVGKHPTAPFYGYRPLIPTKTQNDIDTSSNSSGSSNNYDTGSFALAPYYKYVTYAEAAERVKAISRGLLRELNSFLKLPTKVSDGEESIMERAKRQFKVAIYARNIPEWLLVEQACFMHNFLIVPLYDTLPKDSLQHICDQCDLQVFFCTADKLQNLKDNVLLSSTKEKHCLVVIMDANNSNPSKMEQSAFVKVIFLKDLESTDEADDISSNLPKPSDLFTICYTSGVTGEPKGVMLTHSAMVAACSGLRSFAGCNWLRPDIPLTCHRFREGHERHFSYLPLAHIFERLISQTVISLGGCIGFYSGDLTKVVEEVGMFGPTGFTCVPRVCARIQSKVLQVLQSDASLLGRFKKWLFDTAYAQKLANLSKYNTVRHWFWDRLLFNRLRGKFGCRLEAFISGSAPLPPSTMQFMRLAMASQVYEGYGQTETCGGSFYTFQGDWSTLGHVGGPFACVEFKLVGVGELGYFPEDKPEPRGEICIRGPSCFSGYYLDEAKTNETLDGDGWVHTGDIGRLDSLGRLYIIDRKKHIFKLAQGEYIAPERVENIVLRCPHIQQIFVHGEPTQTHTVAIVVPQRHSASSSPQNDDSITTTTNDDDNDGLHRLLMKEIRSFGKDGTGELNSLELPKAIYLEKEPFSLENGLLTPTLKVKRAVLAQHYRHILRSLYNNDDARQTATAS